MVKSEEWKSLVDTDNMGSMQCSDLFEMIGDYYGLSKNVVENLELSYSSHSATGRSKKTVRFSEGPILDDRV